MKKSLLIEIDKKQAEWVVVAYLANDPRMIEVVETPLDAHATTGGQIAGIDFDTIKKEEALLGHETDPVKIEAVRREHLQELSFATGFVPRNMTIRQMGKKSNHALNYGMSYRRFALENETPERDAKRIVNGYYEAYPGIKHNFHESIRRELNENRTLTNCFGRKVRFLGPWSDDLLKEAFALKPQSTVGDIINKALIKIYHNLYPSVQLLLNNHDSLVMQVWYIVAEELFETCTTLCDYLSPTLHYKGRDFTIANEIKASTISWGNMKDLPHEDYNSFLSALEKIEAEDA